MHIFWKDPNSNNTIKKSGKYFTSINNNKYEIIRNIPRFVVKNYYTDHWGVQWNKFQKTQQILILNFQFLKNGLKDVLEKKFFLN